MSNVGKAGLAGYKRLDYVPVEKEFEFRPNYAPPPDVPFCRKHKTPRLTPSPMFGEGRPDTEDRSDWVNGRAPIFAALDSYIEAGWGAVPRALIERAKAECGGELPTPESAPWYCRAFFGGDHSTPPTPEQRRLIFQARGLFANTVGI